jgi:hypothetical protein
MVSELVGAFSGALGGCSEIGHTCKGDKAEQNQ